MCSISSRNINEQWSGLNTRPRNEEFLNSEGKQTKSKIFNEVKKK